MKKDRTGQLLRIFLDEDDTYQGKPLCEAILARARELGIAGATVLRGLMGYGAQSELHTRKILRLSEGMPLVIEIVDSSEKIDRILPFLDEAVDEGLITLENVRVIKYRHEVKDDE
ncbi:MAG: DUF190 domain-containing protein [FCB group bacterium]|nr:DUF190 domain-containing protein [FCB group bacterium]